MTKKIQKFLNILKSIFKVSKYTIKEGYWSNGNLKYRINYKNGKRYGLCLVRWGNGNLMFRRNYKDGKLQGLCEWWNYNKTLDFRKYYFNGKEVTEFEFDVLEVSEKVEDT